MPTNVDEELGHIFNTFLWTVVDDDAGQAITMKKEMEEKRKEGHNKNVSPKQLSVKESRRGTVWQFCSEWERRLWIILKLHSSLQSLQSLIFTLSFNNNMIIGKDKDRYYWLLLHTFNEQILKQVTQKRVGQIMVVFARVAFVYLIGIMHQNDDRNPFLIRKPMLFQQQSLHTLRE